MGFGFSSFNGKKSWVQRNTSLPHNTQTHSLALRRDSLIL